MKEKIKKKGQQKNIPIYADQLNEECTTVKQKFEDIRQTSLCL